jgi:hypothetical protein
VARLAERSLLAAFRPSLCRRAEDPLQKIPFADGRRMRVPGGRGAIEGLYITMALRNISRGIAVVHGLRLHPDRILADDHPSPEEFQRLSRDLYVPAGDAGFWRGAFRDPSAAEFCEAKAQIEAGGPLTVHLPYSDHGAVSG